MPKKHLPDLAAKQLFVLRRIPKPVFGAAAAKWRFVRNSLIDARRSEGLLLDFVAAQCITAPRISGTFGVSAATSDFSPIWSNETAIEVYFRPQVIHNTANALQAKHRNVAVISLREYQLRENASGPFSQGPVPSPVRITLENKGKIRPQLDRENGFAESSGGGSGTGVEPSLLAC